MVHGEVAGHNPVDLNCLVDFIDGAADQVERHGLHHEHLDFVWLNEAALRYLVESEASLIFAAVEQHLEEGENAHFLLEVSHLRGDCRESGDEIMVTFDSLSKLSDLTTAKGHQHVVKPLEVGANQATEDLFVKLYR